LRYQCIRGLIRQHFRGREVREINGITMHRTLLGLWIAGCCATWAGGCGDDDSAAKTSDAGERRSDAGNSKPKDAGNGDAAAASDAGTSETAATWPMMGYDANNTYFNPNEHTLSVENAKNLEMKWSFTVSGYPPGTPVVAEGKVFVMATAGTYAIDLKTGKQVWVNADIAGTASVAYADGFVYVHATAGASLYKLSAKDGKVVWGPVQTFDQTGCDGTSSPIIGGDKVFVGHSCGGIEVTGNAAALGVLRGGVEAFDTEDGKHVWTYWTVPDDKKGMEDGAMVWSSVAVDVEGGAVFATTGNNYSLSGGNSDSIHGIRFDTGKKKWRTQVRTTDTWSAMVATSGPDSDFGANPILAEVGGKKIVAAGDKGAAFWAFDRETGQMLWSRPDLSASRDAAHGGMLMNGAFDGKYFYVVSNQPGGSPIPDGGVPDGGPAGDTKALLHALDPKDNGKDAWKPVEFQKFTWGAPSLANGLLVVPNDDDLYVFEAATGKQLIMFNTGGTIAAGAAAIVDGRIIVSSGLQYIFDTTAKNNNQIICYALK
jgi:polyvinyl alcohol dehydrogenase (cytochrome)